MAGILDGGCFTLRGVSHEGLYQSSGSSGLLQHVETVACEPDLVLRRLQALPAGSSES